MLDNYLEAIKHEIKQSDLVKTNTLLKAEKWKKSSYEELSKLISQTLSNELPHEQKLRMGTTLSARTLTNIYKGTYKLNYPLDPRTLNTLSKLVLFLNYKNWETFVKKIDKEQTKKLKSASPEEAIETTIQKALKLEYDIYNNLPTIKESTLKLLYEEDSAGFNRIMDTLITNQQENRVLSNPYNPSSYSLLEFEILELKEKSAKVKTKEHWLLCWWGTDEKKYVKRYKNISDHYYFLRKKRNKWKVIANATLADFNDIEIEDKIPISMGV